jgi:cytochrome c-type protein NapC
MRNEQNGKSGLWAMLSRPSAKYSLLGLLVVGFFSGIIFWGGFNTGMEATNKMDFCIGCHEMKDNVYEEYKTTIHYSNRTGTTVIVATHDKQMVDRMRRRVIELDRGTVVRDHARGVYGVGS